AMGNDPNIHTILIFSGGVGRMDAATPIGKLICEVVQQYPDKLFIRTSQMNGSFRDKAFGAPDMVEPITALDGVPFLQGIENSLRAANALIRYTEFQRQREIRKRRDGAAGQTDAGRQAKALELVRATHGQALTESVGKQLLA